MDWDAAAIKSIDTTTWLVTVEWDDDTVDDPKEIPWPKINEVRDRDTKKICKGGAVRTSSPVGVVITVARCQTLPCVFCPSGLGP